MPRSKHRNRVVKRYTQIVYIFAVSVCVRGRESDNSPSRDALRIARAATRNVHPRSFKTVPRRAINSTDGNSMEDGQGTG